MPRSLEIFIAVLFIILISPLALVIAVAIRLESKGPIIYKQKRIGKGGKPFTLLKFRKMMEGLPKQGPMLTGRFDPRLTQVGRFLERTKLDELPQIINVLRGDMSLVGPRPEVPKFTQYYTKKWEIVLSVKPGLLGKNQIKHRNESEMFPPDCVNSENYYIKFILPTKLDVDIQYTKERNFWTDIKIMFHAAFVAIFGSATELTFQSYKIYLRNLFVKEALTALSFFLALLTLYAIQKPAPPLPVEIHQLILLLLFVCLIRCAVFILSKAPRQLHDYHSYQEIGKVIGLVGLGTLGYLTVFCLCYRQLISFLLLAAFIDSVYLSFFIIIARWQLYYYRQKTNFRTDDIPILIVGCNEDTIFTIQSLRRFKKKAYKLIAVVDTSNHRKDHYIAGVPVIELIDDLEHLFKKNQIELVFMIDSALPLSTRLRIGEVCQQLNILFYQIPSTFQIIESALKRMQSVKRLHKLKQRNIRGENSLSNDVAARISICQNLIAYLSANITSNEELLSIYNKLEIADKRTTNLIKTVSSLESAIDQKIEEDDALMEFYHLRRKRLEPILTKCREARRDFMAEKLFLMHTQFQLYSKVIDLVNRGYNQGKYLLLEKSGKTKIEEHLQTLLVLRNEGESVMDKMSQPLDNVSLSYIHEIENELFSIEESIVAPMSEYVEYLKQELVNV